MAAAITTSGYLTDISLCESTTSWTGAGGTNSDFANQGTYCLGVQVKNTTGGTIYYTTDIDCSGGEHIYFWVLITGKPDTKANGGIRLYLATDASNYSYFYVGGNDNYKGGWQCFVLDPTATRNDGLGTLDVSNITRVGIQFKTITTIAGTTYNCFWDAVRYGTGYKVTSGASDAIDMADIFAIDDNSTYKYGVVQKEATGTYVVQGKIEFGDTGTSSVDFVDKNQLIVFPDNAFVSSSFYGLKVLGNTTGTQNFTLGEASGSSGISGCVIKAVGTKTYSLDVSGANTNTIKLYGNTFSGAGVISLPAAATNNDCWNNNFVSCGQVSPSSCEIVNCNFISTTSTSSALLWNSSIDVEDCSFISNTTGAAIQHTASTTSTYTDLNFSANTYDVNNSSGSALEVQKAGTSNPSTYTGSTVTFTASASLVVEIVDSEGDAITAASEITIVKVSDTSVLFNEESVEDGSATYNYTTGGGTVCYVNIMNVVGYQPKTVNNVTLPSTGSTTLTVQLDEDRFYANP